MAERVALATWSGLPDLGEDDRLLVEPLREREIHVDPVVWDAPDVPWRSYDAVVVRSCWDYHHRPAEFLAWVEMVEAMGVPLWNPPATLRWNADKRYLGELEDQGIPTVPTIWIEHGSRIALPDLLRQAGWDEAVLKPVVSAGALNTWRTSRRKASVDNDRLRELAADRAFMLQPYIPEVASQGEWSFVFLGTDFSHAVLKQPRAGDFRVQFEHGGVVRTAEPDDEFIVAAGLALHSVGREWLYARVDGCIVDRRLWIIELELIEPNLFLSTDQSAADRFADAIAESLAAADRSRAVNP